MSKEPVRLLLAHCLCCPEGCAISIDPMKRSIKSNPCRAHVDLSFNAELNALRTHVLGIDQWLRLWLRLHRAPAYGVAEMKDRAMCNVTTHAVNGA